jgi:ureidoacrylate peracid hydrolase
VPDLGIAPTVDVFSAKRRSVPLAPDPTTTAVLIVDMVNDFCRVDGRMPLPDAERLYDPQRAVIEAVRETGGAVVHVVDTHRPNVREDREFRTREPHCIEGTSGAEVVAELTPQEGDLVVLKRRFSGFFGTDLDLLLRDMQVEHVVVMGVVTNICVRSTVHDAFFHGYRVIGPEDTVAATGEREQASSLYDIGTHFGVVSTSSDVMAALRTGAPVANLIIA